MIPYHTLQLSNLEWEAVPRTSKRGVTDFLRREGGDANECVFSGHAQLFYFILFSNQKTKNMHEFGIEPATCPKRRHIAKELDRSETR